MMLLKSIEIENFGPYYGLQKVALKGDVNELILVYGENMAGKTSLLNAVRWCLYGGAKDRSGGSMATPKLINGDAWSEGDKRVSVTLEVIDRADDGESLVRLKRQRQSRQGVPDPVAEKDFTNHLGVTVDGNILSEDQFDDTVNSMLPESISRFFLFDGELLREYEELLQEDSTAHARQVKRAIEMILGVPAVQNGQADLLALEKDAARAYNREAKKHEGIDESAQAAERLQDELDLLERDINRLREQEEDGLAELRGVKEELAKHEHLANSARGLAQAEDTIARIAKDREKKLLNRRDLGRDLWRDILAPRLKHEIANLERDQERIAKALSERRDLERERAERLSSLETARCSVCGQPIPEESRLKEQARVGEIDDRLSQLVIVADQERLDDIGATVRRMREIAPAGVESGIKQIEADLAEMEIESHKADRAKEQAEEDLRGIDPRLVPEFEKRRDRLNKHLGEIEAALKRTEKTFGEKQNELQAHQRAMKEQDEPALRHLRTCLDLYQGLVGVYNKSIGDLTDELRSDVEAEASRIFRDLTTDKTYAGLRINANYGLTIVGGDGKDVPVRSAGAEQVVALSLIGALNRLAARRGPVIMDTPFGRLDRQHRENILKFVPTLADQVVLLVHSGEIDPERDLEPVKGKVSSEIEIEHIESARSALGERA